MLDLVELAGPPQPATKHATDATRAKRSIMPTIEEIQKLVIEVENLSKLRDLNALLQTEAKTMEQLQEQYKAAAIGQSQYEQRMALHAGKTIELNQRVKELQKSTQGAMGAMGAMQMGYALQDFFATQGGMAQKFNAIANNLQMLAVSMGIGGGWFLAITGVIAGLQAIASNWDAIRAQLDNMPDPKELKAKADEAKKKAEEYDKLLKEPSPEESRKTGLAKGALGMFDTAGVAAGIKASLIKEGKGVGMSEAATQAFIAKEGLAGASPDVIVQRVNDEERRVMDRGYGEETKRMMLGMRENGPEAEALRKRVLGMAAANAGAFPPGFATVAGRSLQGLNPLGIDETTPNRDMFDLFREQKAAADHQHQLAMDKAAREQSDRERKEARMMSQSPAEVRKEANARAMPAAPLGPLISGGTEAMELSQLQTMHALNEGDAAADRLLGMNGPALQNQLAIEARIQQIVRKMSQTDPGSGASGGYSFLPSGTW